MYTQAQEVCTGPSSPSALLTGGCPTWIAAPFGLRGVQHTHTHTRTHAPVPPSACPTGAGGDCSRGHRSPTAFSDEARESQHSGYLTNKPLRF